MTTATKARPKKAAKQKHLPGMAPPKNTKIENLAEKFVQRRNDWQAANKPMNDARDLLHTAMKEAGLTRYELPNGAVVEVLPQEKVVVRKAKGQNGDGEAE